MNAESYERERILEATLDAALATYPRAPLPLNFTDQLMAQVAMTRQVSAPAASIGSATWSLRHYLRLYSFELAFSSVITLLLAAVVVWPLFAQAGLLPVLWSSTIATELRLATPFTQYLSSWYAVGLSGVILLELGIVTLAWVGWVERPRTQIW